MYIAKDAERRFFYYITVNFHEKAPHDSQVKILQTNVRKFSLLEWYYMYNVSLEPHVAANDLQIILKVFNVSLR
jgi:hypothetical protein